MSPFFNLFNSRVKKNLKNRGSKRSELSPPPKFVMLRRLIFSTSHEERTSKFQLSQSTLDLDIIRQVRTTKKRTKLLSLWGMFRQKLLSCSINVQSVWKLNLEVGKSANYAPLWGPTPYPLYTIFDRKGTPFVQPPNSKFSCHFHAAFNKLKQYGHNLDFPTLSFSFTSTREIPTFHMHEAWKRYPL